MELIRNMVFALFAVLAIGVAFKALQSDDGRGPATVTAQQSRSTPQQRQEPRRESRSIAALTNEMVLRPARNGHYYLKANINGAEITFMVDTGATSVALRAEDAERIGFNLHGLDYSQVYNTANGQIRAAPVVLDEISIGGLSVDNVEASVQQAPLHISLLGMSFLSKLDGYRVEDGNLILSW